MPGAAPRFLATIGYLVAVAAITLTPRSGEVTATTLCLICGRRGAADAALNLLMFVPLGWLAAGRLARSRRGVAYGRTVAGGIAAGALASLTIELLQLPIPGRDASVGDLAFNTLGAGVGAVVGRFAMAPRAAPGGRAARLAAATGGGAAAILLGAWLLGPSLPDSEWWGQWTPDLGHLAEYRGEALAVGVGGLPVESGRLREPGAARARLRRREPVRIVVVAGPPPEGIAPIFSIYDSEQREIFLLGADGHDGVLRFRTRGSALRFDDPPLRFPGALAGVAAGDTVEIGLTAPAAPRSWGEGACMSARPLATVCASWSPATAWDLLLPMGGGVGRALAWLWLASLFLPAGALAARCGGRPTLAVGGFALTSLALVPTLTPIGAARPGELAAVAAGAWLPWLTVRALRARRGAIASRPGPR